MSDPLAPYRKTAISPAIRTGVAKPDQRSSYLAFDGKDRVERLKIHRANDPSRSPSYAGLMDVIFDGDFGTNFVLVWDFMILSASGKNLRELVIAIQQGKADFIQEFDSDRWDLPTDPNAPVIEWIEITVPNGAPSFGNQNVNEPKKH